jgi:succinate dehydrogenase/fumarate reductase flavoprotein subunit
VWQTAQVGRSRTPHVVIVGSGLAGLSCAEELARSGCEVTVVTASRAGRDGATQRVHALAPWILLTAPWVRGDGPARFANDLVARSGDLHRGDLPEVLAGEAHGAAIALCELLDLAPLDGGRPVLLPDDDVPRGLRCLPRRTPLLAPLLQRCVAAGVRVLERTLAARVCVDAGRATGVVVIDRDRAMAEVLSAHAVVLACGGAGAVFPRSTAPRWCRGTGLALASSAGALLHRPSLMQSLPVTATPPLYFPTTTALLRGRIQVDGVPLPRPSCLDAATRAVAEALERGASVTLDPADQTAAVLPPRVRETSVFRQSGVVPLTLAVHHMIGGVAIDAWGRTSLPGLYACGEAAGGVQGARRTMGTGLLEARVFGVRAARALAKDLRRLEITPEKPRVGALQLPLVPEALEERMNQLLAPLAFALRPELLVNARSLLASWPLGEGGGEPQRGLMADIRRSAALSIIADGLSGAGEARRATTLQGAGEEAV